MITTLNQTLYAVAWTLAQATKDALNGEVEMCHTRLDEITEEIAQYKALIKTNQEPEGAKYQSEGQRPAGWMTVIEYLYQNDPHFFDYCDDIAVETSGFGIKASRYMKDQGMGRAHKVKAPECLGDDQHIVDVNCYPADVLALCCR